MEIIPMPKRSKYSKKDRIFKSLPKQFRKPPADQTCPRSGKRLFVSAKAATRFAEAINRAYQNPYLCVHCEHYHLTSLPQQAKTTPPAPPDSQDHHKSQ